ncbi:hypothetical protein [Aquimarina sp. MMG016]|uniref:hypothetical protein n=1 Tax=Aquimarina sp. MMG016 TaxID=2822690 RepID=UPI001B3A43C4|nr:hypothetical protein [Aquimarina sp. MMG016]MBQ4820586.1 hypothetical protein [Aquimarina sp. MMG016]
MDLTQAIELFQDALFLGKNGLLGLGSYISEIINYAYALAAVIMIILVGSKVMKYMVNPSSNLDPFVLVRPVLVLAALSLYQPLVENLLVVPTNIVIDITEEAAVKVTRSSNIVDFNNRFQLSMENVQSTGGAGAGIYDILQVNPFLELIHLIILFISSIVAGYILLRQLILKSIYFILGVFVLPFSLIPGNQDIIKKWFLGFLSVLLWIPILNILKTIIVIINNNLGSGFSNVLLSTALQVVMIFAVLKVPQYANILVASGNETDSNFGSGIITSPFKLAANRAYKSVIGGKK